MANLSLEHGNSDGSCFAYVWLGRSLDRASATIEAGIPLRQAWLRSGRKARTGPLPGPYLPVLRASRHALDADMSAPAAIWLRRAFDAANKTGDLTFAAYSCNQPDHQSSRRRRSARRCATGSREWSAIRAEGAVSVSSSTCMTGSARADPDAARTDAEIRILR